MSILLAKILGGCPQIIEPDPREIAIHFFVNEF